MFVRFVVVSMFDVSFNTANDDRRRTRNSIAMYGETKSSEADYDNVLQDL